MKYLCLLYQDESIWQRMSREELVQVYSEYAVFRGDTKRSGQYLGGNALQPTSTAATVQVRGGKVSVTDGPFAETKEQLGGYVLIEANDLNDAIQVASKIPGARLGTIEVRPVMEQPVQENEGDRS